MSLTEQAFFSELLSGLVLNPQQLKHTFFAQRYQDSQGHLQGVGGLTVKFPRLDIVLRGTYTTSARLNDDDLRHGTLMHGDLLFIPAYSNSQPIWEKDVLLLSLLFTPSYIGFSFFDKRAASAGFHRLRKLEVPQQNAGELEHILQALSYLGARVTDPNVSRYLVLSLLHVCHSQLCLPPVNKIQRGAFLYKSICTYIQDNYAGALSRESTAAIFNITANHLSRIFQLEGNMSFIDYLHWVRLGKAKMILQKYHLNVNEVARRCGYSDGNYFCRLFKRQFGLTPSEYRKQFLSV
ncbi:AraC family transcriptional regulator [Hafnia paralvei]|uniref:helix-turn-helix domain-containing protein n=1 Tax=Hafnia paralvei TaxID=546367 RepID=UPI000DF47CEF|nr:AraC family transcriptional regulator [Hafnia paralvei]RDA66066.1 AraC family transcriptional regulator [Hafnia paralvei]RDA66633.1 AraC family transcriptional regulator [Hafnia paralvei]RDA66955.1 AraC family transcriptional regulator [Hafnia paralvei]RDA77355.1 AraC family transcriptional regulator [Hafnia paralvei]RDA78079.1 AraC family transcriptional regulator [Hafnia paralvei]